MLGTTSTTMLDRIHKAHRGLRLLDVLLSAALAIGLMLSVGRSARCQSPQSRQL
jgi:hypothetical protein